MDPLRYHSGELVQAGDLVRLGTAEGVVHDFGDNLRDWGLSGDEARTSVMIQSTAFGLLCLKADSEDLQLIARRRE